MSNGIVSIPESQRRNFATLCGLFALGLNCRLVTGLSRVSINRHLAALRRCVAWHGEQIQPMSGEIEVDEPSVGARRGRGNRGRGAFGKTAVFGLFKRHDQV